MPGDDEGDPDDDVEESPSSLLNLQTGGVEGVGDEFVEAELDRSMTMEVKFAARLVVADPEAEAPLPLPLLLLLSLVLLL